MKKTKLIITIVIILSITLLGVCTYAGSKGKGHGMFGFGKYETREQYNEMPEKIEAHKGFPMGRANGRIPFSKLSEEDLEKIKEKGEFDKKQGERKKPEFSEEALSQMKEKMTTDLKVKLEEGKITQEQYDEMLKSIENGKPLMPGRIQGKKNMGKGFPKGDFPRGEHKRFKTDKE